MLRKSPWWDKRKKKEKKKQCRIYPSVQRHDRPRSKTQRLRQTAHHLLLGGFLQLQSSCRGRVPTPHCPASRGVVPYVHM